MKVYCSLTAEQATLYEAVVQDTLQHVDAAEGIERRGHRARDADEAQAGLQPPGAFPGRWQRAGRADRASWSGWPRCWKKW